MTHDVTPTSRIVTLTGGTDESDELKRPMELLVSHFLGGGDLFTFVGGEQFCQKNFLSFAQNA